jgi:N-acetylmuramate 1-kinase
MDLDSAIRDQVEKATHESSAKKTVLKLAGGAGSRSYYRVGDLPHSHVVMAMPQDTKLDEDALDFVDVHNYLRKLGVRVPEILYYDQVAEMMVLEDLTDLTLEQALKHG